MFCFKIELLSGGYNFYQSFSYAAELLASWQHPITYIVTFPYLLHRYSVGFIPLLLPRPAPRPPTPDPLTPAPPQRSMTVNLT